MKKSILVIAAVSAVACALSACGKDKGSSGQYDELNSMLEMNYSSVTITINNKYTEENITLKSEYKIEYEHTQTTVEYKVDRFAPILFDDPSADVVTTYEGTAVIKNGVISANDIGLTADIAKLPIDFKEEYFEGAELTGMYLNADVKDVSGFMGTSIDCTDMHVYAEFLEMFYNITVTYKQSGHEIEYKYVFNK